MNFIKKFDSLFVFFEKTIENPETFLTNLFFLKKFLVSYNAIFLSLVETYIETLYEYQRVNKISLLNQDLICKPVKKFYHDPDLHALEELSKLSKVRRVWQFLKKEKASLNLLDIKKFDTFSLSDIMFDFLENSFSESTPKDTWIEDSNFLLELFNQRLLFIFQLKEKRDILFKNWFTKTNPVSFQYYALLSLISLDQHLSVCLSDLCFFCELFAEVGKRKSLYEMMEYFDKRNDMWRQFLNDLGSKKELQG